MFHLLRRHSIFSIIGALVVASLLVPSVIATPLPQDTDEFRGPNQWDQENQRISNIELQREWLRQNFRAHYKIVRNDADELKSLTEALQSYAENQPAPQLSRDMLAKVAKIQKLAHRVRTNMAGRNLPKAKSATTAVSATNLNPQQLLLAQSRAVNELASKLQNAVAGYLATDNEQTVSVQALKKNSGKTGFDPNSIEILTASRQMEQLAQQIRRANQQR